MFETGENRNALLFSTTIAVVDVLATFLFRNGLVLLSAKACAYIRDNGDSSKGKKRKIVAKDRRKVGKKLSSRRLGQGGPLEVSLSK